MAFIFTPTYNTWSNMKSRCLNAKNPSYRFYGGRGIKVCERWLTFANFLADMGERPEEGLELDRINNERGYEPGNCRWITHVENLRNTPRATSIQFDGEIRSKTEWARRIGISLAGLTTRLKKWPIGLALTTPPAVASSKRTHCPRGHPLSGDNLYVRSSDGSRHCRACRKVQHIRRSPHG